MTTLDWALSAALLLLYLVCLFTVFRLTFTKGYMLLAIFGIFFPILWLIGAVLPPKAGSRYSVEEGIARQRAIEEMTR